MTARNRKPIDDDLAMPAEWAPHAGCYVSWPCNERTWQGHFAEAKEAFTGVIEAINAYEPVTVLSDPSTTAEARAALGSEIEIMVTRLDDSWIRDNGPIFVRSQDGKVALVNFRFNGWGKFHPFDNDDRAPKVIADHLGMRRYDAPFVLEGGSISTDGEGTLMTTEQCLLNPNRNPELSKGEIELMLQDYLGIRKVLWLGRGQEGDLTDGHVDGVACFAGPHVVVAAHTTDDSDPNHQALSENLGRLGSCDDAKGRSIEVIRMVQPKQMRHRGIPITPSYCNYYIANGAVIMPTYGTPEDKIALDILRSAHAGREVVGVPGSYIEVGGGVVHCITQQRPAGERLKPIPDR